MHRSLTSLFSAFLKNRSRSSFLLGLTASAVLALAIVGPALGSAKNLAKSKQSSSAADTAAVATLASKATAQKRVAVSNQLTARPVASSMQVAGSQPASKQSQPIGVPN